MNLFPVLTDLDAPRFLVLLEEPRYDAGRKVLGRGIGKNMCRTWYCTEGRVSVGAVPG